jgi:hypothetical protein
LTVHECYRDVTSTAVTPVTGSLEVQSISLL